MMKVLSSFTIFATAVAIRSSAAAFGFSALIAHRSACRSSLSNPSRRAVLLQSSLSPDNVVDVIPKKQATTKSLTKKRIPPVRTWKRRLDTKQDPFNIHKWSGFGWWVSSTAIFGTGTLSGFTQAPPVLESYTYLFLIATIVQSASSVPMALRYRSNEPAAQRGFISSAVTSVSTTVIGVWLSPFVNEQQQNFLQPGMVAGFIATLVLFDAIYSLTSFEDIKKAFVNLLVAPDPTNAVAEQHLDQEQPELQPKQSADYGTFLTTIPWALPMNLIVLNHLLVEGPQYAATAPHVGSTVRDYFVAVITSHGSSMDLVYYASMVTSIAVGVGNLAVTLRHRKLITKQVEDIAMIGSWVVTITFNLRAAGLF